MKQAVQKVARVPAVECRDPDRLAEAEGHELPDVVVTSRAVDLVDHDHDGQVEPSQQSSNAVILLGDAGGGVHHHQHRVGCLHRPLALGGDLPIEGALATESTVATENTVLQDGARWHPPSSVDEEERPAQPFGDELLAIPGHPGALLDDRLAAPDDAVEEGGFAHVGATHHGDDGQVHEASRARRRESPSVGTISTGRGSSEGSTPSRNRPPLRQTSGSR